MRLAGVSLPFMQDRAIRIYSTRAPEALTTLPAAS